MDILIPLHIYQSLCACHKSPSSLLCPGQTSPLLPTTHEFHCVQNINQSINQFYFLLSATSSMPLALYNGTHTYTYTVKYSTHTSIHTRQPFRRRYNFFFFFFFSGTHTLTLAICGRCERLAPSLFWVIHL